MWNKVLENKNFGKYLMFFSCFLTVIIAAFVYYTGGTTRVYANLMYIPIAIVSSTRGKKTGIIHSAISAFLVGPFMPLNRSLNISQQPVNWITRLVIYMTIAFIIGFFADYNRKNKEYITNLLTHDMITNFKNIDSLKNEVINTNCLRTIIVVSVIEYENILNFFGYEFIYRTLYKFSKELKEQLGQYKNIDFYRYDGMKFVLTVIHDNGSTDIKGILNDLNKFNKYTLFVDNIPIYIELSIGIAKINEETSILEGIRQALIALRYAKINEKKIMIFDNSLENHYKDVVNIASDFVPALKNGNIKTAYQNIYNSNEGIYGKELLVRWITDSGAQIFPSNFIPVIEKTELINELTKHIIDVAIDDILKNEGTVVSINFSPKDFREEVVQYVLDRIKDEGINPEYLQIEVTEDILVRKDEAICYLELISKAGIKIAIDDFGSGYSSLQYLSEFPFNVIKIDRALIQKMKDDALTGDLVKSIVEFCKNNNVLTVAEGVENKEIADKCMELGIELLQGYYYHKPVIFDNK